MNITELAKFLLAASIGSVFGFYPVLSVVLAIALVYLMFKTGLLSKLAAYKGGNPNMAEPDVTTASPA